VQNLEPVTLSRRSILRVGLGTTALFATGTLLGACQPSQNASVAGHETLFRVLRPTDIAILGAITPVVLDGIYPTDRARANATFMPQLDSFLFSTNTMNHEVLHQLLDLLDIRVIRWAMTGLWSDWQAADDASIEAFLQRWRDSRVGQLRAGYAQLTQIINLVWFAQPANTARIYPGAPRHEILAASPA
jgi:hypothetical protein